MKKLMVILGAVALLSVWTLPAMAGGIINKSNLSSDYFRSLTRNAATDAADIVAYNPAGVMKMADGLYIKGDLMYVTKDYTNKVPDVVPDAAFAGEDGDFENDLPSTVPGFFAVYKQEKWAGFFSVTIPGGGGEVDYDEGSAFTSLLALQLWEQSDVSGVGAGPWVYPALTGAKLEGNSFAVGYTLGGAYEINSMVSVAGGIRYVDSHKVFKGHIDLDTAVFAPPGTPDRYEIDLDQDATGMNFFLGVNVAPVEKLNLGFLYVSNTSLEYESDVSKDTSGGAITEQIGWGDGDKFNEDIPALLGLGVSYQITPKLRTEFNYTLYIEAAAELDSISGRFNNAGNSSDTALSFEYAFNPQWKVSLGYMITKIMGMDPEQLLPPAPELDANTIAAGVVWAPNDRLRINAGLTNVDYAEVTTDFTGSNSPKGTEFDKHSTAISLGVQYRFF